MIENTFDELKVGDTGSFIKTITEADVTIFAGISGDYSWLHTNEVLAREGHFGARIVHGILLVGLISHVIGNIMPGAGTVYETQDCRFLKPAYIMDTTEAVTEVVEKLPRGRVRLRTLVYNQHGDIIVDGEAIVIPPRRHFALSPSHQHLSHRV